MTLSEYLENELRSILNDKSTKIDILRKLYGGQQLFTLKNLEEAWKYGKIESERSNKT